MTLRTKAAFFLLLFTAVARSQTTTISGNDIFGLWGPINQLSLGESLTVPVGANDLQSFTFPQIIGVGPSINYQIRVYAYDRIAAQTIGSALYTSGTFTSLDPGTQSITVTPNIHVTAGGTYIALVTAGSLPQVNNYGAELGINTTQTYSGGKFEISSDPTLVTWIDAYPYDAAFSVTFGTAVFGLTGYDAASLTPNQYSIGAPINAGLLASNGNANFNTLATALDMQSSLGPALDQLSPLAFGRFSTETAFNNASFELAAMDNYLAGRRGPDGNFLAGSGGFDASGLVMNDSSCDPNLTMIHSRLLAWNPAPTHGVISDVANPLLGGIDTKAEVNPSSLAPQPSARPWNVYARGSVILAQGSSDADVAHFGDHTTSIVLGADYRLTPYLLVGLTAGYGHTDADLDQAGSSATVDSYSPGLYASYADKGWYANFAGSYVHNAYTQDRAIAFLGQTAHGAPDGDEGVADLDGGYDFHRGALTFGPLAGVQYTRLSIDSYQESGSIADLDVNSQTADSLRSRLGGRVSFTFAGAGMTFMPHLAATWQHEFLDQSRGITSQFDGQGLGSFSVQTENPSRDSALVDAGLDAQIAQAIVIFADYEVQAGQDNYFGQSVEAGVKIGL